MRRLINEKLGYPLERHHYHTKDGYINTVFRIFGPIGTKEGSSDNSKPVVIYQHGLIDCGAGIICDEE